MSKLGYCRLHGQLPHRSTSAAYLLLIQARIVSCAVGLQAHRLIKSNTPRWLKVLLVQPLRNKPPGTVKIALTVQRSGAENEERSASPTRDRFSGPTSHICCRTSIWGKARNSVVTLRCHRVVSIDLGYLRESTELAAKPTYLTEDIVVLFPYPTR